MSIYNTAYCSCVLRKHWGPNVLYVKDKTSVMCRRFGGILRHRYVLCESSELHFMIRFVPHSKHTPSLLLKPFI
jgi:hypothetical protein